MGSFLSFFMFMHLCFLLPSFFHRIVLTNSSSFKQPLCHNDESSALLQFKHSFSIEKFASGVYPKVASWKVEGESNADCCSWDGVECNEDTGHVIGLDLSGSLLYGSINSSSSLFSLVHLRSLNLADNHFNYSHIPSGIGRLSRLTTLNLSSSFFTGQIPLEILRLSNLTSLDLSCNGNWSNNLFLRLETPSLQNLVQNLTKLKELHLSEVNVSSTIPNTLANLSSLKSLKLSLCGLYGEFPTALFNLPKLQVLYVQHNKNLTARLPEFHHASPLKELTLVHTNFFGKLPDSIGNLNSLNHLRLSECNFFGPLPTSLNNLTRLITLDLYSNNFMGQIPYSLTNLTKLTSLRLAHNQFQGPIPTSLSKLKELETLRLDQNNISGTIKLNVFLRLKVLGLSGNNILLLTNNTTSLPKLNYLGLGSCNLREFPNFLRFQDELVWLDLKMNYIHGQIPQWMWNTSRKTLETIDLSRNILTGFDQDPVVLASSHLSHFDLSYNILQGTPPIPPPNIVSYVVSNNRLTGEISTLICHVTSLSILDLSNNEMSGTIPACMGNFSKSLSVMNLKGNKFRGTIPQTYTKGNNLKMIDLSQNQLVGQIPRSMANCAMLEILDLADNRLEDIFPFWLGALSELQVLVLRSNNFRGAIQSPSSNSEFPKLRIIDLSDNDFMGNLPVKYFQNSYMLKIVHVEGMEYMHANFTYVSNPMRGLGSYLYSITITNKGLMIEYEKIQNIFIAIDLSRNKFRGEIPESIGNLKGIQLLNLSNNDLVGHIPPFLGNLENLESLDLSQNKLSGEIPQQLVLLTFLAFINVSNNHLTGPIPQGKQFNTFENNSYLGNSALCGEPLSKKCGNQVPPPPPLTVEVGNDSEFPSGVDWIVISLGFGTGLVVGLSIGKIITTRYHEWFVEKFGKRQERRRKQKKWGPRN